MINRNVFIVANILTLACLGSLALDAHAEGRATSSFRYPEAAPGKRVDTHQGLLEYVISNVGDEPIYIQNEMHPITSKSSARLMGDSLSVVAPDGTEAPYQGSTVTLRNRGPLPSTPIAPGETKVYLLDIQKSYIIQPGVPYIVSLKNGGIFTVPSVGKQSAVRAYDSNVATVLIDERHYIRPRTKEEIIEYQRAIKAQRLREAQSLAQPAATCSAAETQRFADAKSSGANLAFDGLNAMSNAYNHIYDGSGNYVQSTFSSSRWARWFGIHQSPINILQGQDPSDQYAETGVFVIYARATESQGVPIVQDCYCDYSRVPTATIAYVDDRTSNIINTCPAFATIDMLPIGNPDYASSVGTFLHEVSHFIDGSWPGTLDTTFTYPNGVYTYAVAQTLPKAEAVEVAANYEFYFINYDGE